MSPRPRKVDSVDPTEEQEKFLEHVLRGDTPHRAAVVLGLSKTKQHNSTKGVLYPIVRGHTNWFVKKAKAAQWDKKRIRETLLKAFNMYSLAVTQQQKTELLTALNREGVTVDKVAKNIAEHLDAKKIFKGEHNEVLATDHPDYDTQVKSRRDILDVMGLREKSVKHQGAVVHQHQHFVEYVEDQWERDREFDATSVPGEIISAEAEEIDGATLEEIGVAEGL